MINTLVLVGKVLEAPEIRTTAKGNTVAHLLIEADRMFRNEDGSLSSDIFDVTLWKGIAEECASVCRPGSIVGIKGRLQSTTNGHNGRQFHNVDILSERMQALEKL